MSEDEENQAANENRNHLFSRRRGHRSLPEVMDHRLCKEFRDRLWLTVKDHMPTEAYYRSNEYMINSRYEQDEVERLWANISLNVQINILQIQSHLVKEGRSGRAEMLAKLVNEGEFDEVIDFCEILFQLLEKNDSLYTSIFGVFDAKFAPYAIDASAEPVIIVPLDTPEAGVAIVQSFEDIYKSGASEAHRNLRAASKHINASDYPNAVDNSVNAVESLAKEFTQSKKLSDALTKLQNDKVINHPALKDGIGQLYNYASNTARHGQTTQKAGEYPIDRDEALLIFGLCASFCGFLARKKIETQKGAAEGGQL